MKNKKALLFNLALAAILFLVVMSISFLLIQRTAKEDKEAATKTKTVKITPVSQNKGSIKLVALKSLHIFTPNEQIIVQAYANSQNSPVGGYDIVLTYNPKKAKFIAAKNLRDGTFQTISQERDGTVHFTGVKKPDVKETITFHDDPLASFTFQPIISGSVTFALDFIPGQTKKSNLLTDDAKQILGEVKSLTVDVGSSITLQKGKDFKLKDGKTILTLVDVVPLKAGCVDCIEQATIQIKSGSDEKTLDVKAGGVAGANDLYKNAFGYSFEAEEFGKDILKINVAQQ